VLTLVPFDPARPLGFDLHPTPVRVDDQGQPSDLFDPDGLACINGEIPSAGLRTPYLSGDLDEPAWIKRFSHDAFLPNHGMGHS